MFGQLLHNGLLHDWGRTQLLELHTLESLPLGNLVQVLRVRHNQRHRVLLRRVTVHADVLHHRAGLQFRFHLAQGYVLAGLQLDQILLTIYVGLNKGE